MKARWKGKIIAESDETVVVERNHYFPIDSVNKDYLIDSKTKTICGWKGIASYYNLDIDGDINKDAVWYYPEPKEAAKKIKNHVAFWKGVEVIK